MSLKNLFSRLQRSVAIRVSVLFAVLFSLGFACIFGLLYWSLGRQLEAREHEALGLRLRQYADIYGARGLEGLQERVFEDSQSPHVRSLFIRLLSDRGVVWASVPPDWIDQDARKVSVPDEWGRMIDKTVVTVRIPRDELEDLAVLSTRLRDGLLLQVGRSTDSRTALLEPLRRLFVQVASAVVVVGFACGLIVAYRATRPLRQITATAQRIVATGELNERVPLSARGDEIAELVACFNNVLDRNSALIRSMREALDNVAHDLRTPLTSLRGQAELALTRTDDPQAQDALAECIERADEVLRLLRALMEIAEAEAGVMRLAREPVDLRDLAAGAASLYTEVAEDRGVELVTEPSAPVPALGDATRLRQAVANLVDNAIKYTPSGGRVTVSCGIEEGWACIKVADTGPGVPEPEQSRIWERLYRCDQSRAEPGLGLGLSMVRAIAEAHGGGASVRNRPEGGAEFRLRLPLPRTEGGNEKAAGIV